ncbi:MAG: NDP-sugar synthase [Actinobacteria bacterium]|nr:NDP-sugar synthase [Actinomycetota bacterium]
MRAVVLVGGEGTRLRPLTYKTPKQLLPVANVPMIERVVAHLAAHDVDHVVLSMGYRPDAFHTAYPDGHCAGVSITYAVEPEPMGTAGGIGFAARFAEIDDTFIVVNGDVLTDLDIGALVAFHRARGGQATISLTPVDDPSAFGVVPTFEDGRVEAFVEKPPKDEAPTNLINAGTYVLEPSVIEAIPEGRAVSIERETFPSLVGEGALYAMASEGYWVDAGTPPTYLRANLDLKGDPVLVGAGAVIDPSAVVTDSVIGPGACVGAGARVAESVVLAGAVVEPGASLARRIVDTDAIVEVG